MMAQANPTLNELGILQLGQRLEHRQLQLPALLQQLGQRNWPQRPDGDSGSGRGGQIKRHRWSAASGAAP